MSNPAHLQQLKKGPTAWNKWRRANRSTVPDLSDADLTEINPLYFPNSTTEIIFADLSKYNLSGVKLAGADLSGVKLRGSNLSSADLGGAKLFEADLREANLKNARLIKTEFNLARLEGANLTAADLTQAQLSEARLKNAVLKKATLVEVEADNINLIGANLAGANLNKADMMDANCYQVNFTRATLRGVTLLGANLSETDFRGADLSVSNLEQTLLSQANLQGVNLSAAKLRGSNLVRANLSRADCSNADLAHTYLNRADLSHCNLQAADLFDANLSDANLHKANLASAILVRATLVRTNLSGALLDNAHIYGISVWDIAGKPKNQNNLVITPREAPAITVDELEVAQFIYLLINNAKVRNAIDTITSKAVLILGRFYKQRKDVLDALRDELRKRNYIPIVFDFEKPGSKDLTETVSTLAQMSRFVIADITDAKSIPQELSHIIPNNPSLPIVSIMSQGYREYAMYEHFARYPWVLPIYKYRSKKSLIGAIRQKIIDPGEKLSKQLRPAS